MAVAQLSEPVHDVVKRERQVVADRLEAIRAQSRRLHEVARLSGHEESAG